ncbi:hypothetical protein B0H10DRAFT_2210198 [Mycena sp. CBHHK59/15]|nr:hypothetical protein B0H10DRAFT_2210198 [Mycena sp. CBHHK59/15]
MSAPPTNSKAVAPSWDCSPSISKPGTCPLPATTQNAGQGLPVGPVMDHPRTPSNDSTVAAPNQEEIQAENDRGRAASSAARLVGMGGGVSLFVCDDCAENERFRNLVSERLRRSVVVVPLLLFGRMGCETVIQRREWEDATPAMHVPPLIFLSTNGPRGHCLYRLGF